MGQGLLIAGAWADGAATLPDIPNGHSEASLTEKFSSPNDVCHFHFQITGENSARSLTQKQGVGRSRLPSTREEVEMYIRRRSRLTQHSSDAFGRGWGGGEHLECSF